jgi:hypothetical protein
MSQLRLEQRQAVGETSMGSIEWFGVKEVMILRNGGDFYITGDTA